MRARYLHMTRMKDEVRIQLGVPRPRYAQATALYCQAFREKLCPFLGPIERASRFLAAGLVADRAFVALHDDEVVGTIATSPLRITNTTPDVVIDTELVAMTLTGISITGPDASAFELPAFTPGTVLDPTQFADLLVKYSPLAAGVANATLELRTDVGAPFGGSGQSFSSRFPTTRS